MKTFVTTLRMTLGLTSLSLSVLCLFYEMDLVPDPTPAVLHGRKALCETIAIYDSSAATRGDGAMIRGATHAIFERNPDIGAITVRLADGTVLAHEERQPAGAAAGSSSKSPTVMQAEVPIFLAGRPWGTVVVQFRPIHKASLFGTFASPAFRFIALVTLGLFLAHFLYIAIVVGRQGAGSGSIPARVRATLDTLVEGVLLLDLNRRIALVNESFARTVGLRPWEIEGRTVEELNWTGTVGRDAPERLPWEQAVEHGGPELGAIVGLETDTAGVRTLSVNSTPIVADDGRCHGVLATFDDMTRIERKNLQLRKLIDRLRRSRAEIRVQNQQLIDLATLDPLTSCLNRRSFFERFDAAWQTADRHGQALSCVMLDIDHFKSVNDRYGHAIGDQAIQIVAGVLRASVRVGDLVCRYGGEEFCVLLLQTDADEAAIAAERFRKAIEGSEFAGISVTSSFGVASVSMGSADPHDLINRADQALYAAKRTGRNRVVRFDQLPADAEAAAGESKESNAPPPAPAAPEALPPDTKLPIPYYAVTSLISALAHRDPSTAEHSHRVATLCVQTAKGLMSERDCYTLEIGALLHDIGKLGIPDSILNKPGRLTDAEWEVMKVHDEMGIEIITAAFSSEALRELIRTHHAWFGGNPRHPELPTGDAISLGARILTIADSYDAMVSDRVYRKGRSQEEAFVELRRCAGVQFDPALVERFIETALACNNRRRAPFAALSKSEALQIGLLIEKLAEALDTKDLSTLRLVASQLLTTADAYHVDPIANVARRLVATITAQGDWLEMLEVTDELLELCRSTQASYLATCMTDDPNALIRQGYRLPDDADAPSQAFHSPCESCRRRPANLRFATP